MAQKVFTVKMEEQLKHDLQKAAAQNGYTTNALAVKLLKDGVDKFLTKTEEHGSVGHTE